MVCEGERLHFVFCLFTRLWQKVSGFNYFGGVLFFAFLVERTLLVENAGEVPVEKSGLVCGGHEKF